MKAACTVDGCDRPASARGMCRKHYEHWRRVRPDGPRCTVDGCERPAVIRGLCDSHRKQADQRPTSERVPLPGWRDNALCRDAGPMSPWMSKHRYERRAAALACGECPVVECCAEAAEKHPKPIWGVWGGVDRAKSRRSEAWRIEEVMDE